MMLLPDRLLPNAICMHCFSSVTVNGSQLITHAAKNEKYKLLSCIQFASNQGLM